MKLKLKKEDLNKGLQAVHRIAQLSNTELHTQSGFLIKAVSEHIEFQANGFDMAIRIHVPGIIEEKGEAYIANPYLTELTRRLPGDEIEMIKQNGDTQLLLKGGKLKFECLTINPDDFSEVDVVNSGQVQFTTDSITLKYLIEHTAFACSTDTVRPIFSGTYLDVSGTTINMVATDTHRLAYKSASLEKPVDQPFKAVIPSRLLAEISRHLPTDIPEMVDIILLRNSLAVTFTNVYMKTRLIEGEFPDYHRVIPSQFSCVATVNRQEFTNAVERASLIAKDAGYNVIDFMVTNESINMTSQNPDYGTIADSVPCQAIGDPLHIALNGKLLLDLLKHCEADDVVLKLGENKPVLVQNKDDNNCLFVVTPMRTK